MSDVFKGAGRAIGKAAETLSGVANRLASDIEVRGQVDPVPLLTPQAPELGQAAVHATIIEAPTPTMEDDPEIKRIVLDYEQKRAPGIGKQDPLRLANGQAGEDAIRKKHTPTDKLLRSYLQGALTTVRSPEFQDKIEHQARIEGRESGEFKATVEKLATIMAYPPPELLRAVDMDKSYNQLDMLQDEKALIKKYSTLKAAEQGYNMGVLMNDPGLQDTLAYRVTPEERLAMEATTNPQFGGMGIWKSPAPTVNAAIKLVEAAPSGDKAYLELVEAMVVHIHDLKGRGKWAGDVTDANCNQAANKIENMLRHAITYAQKDYRLSLPQVVETKDDRRVKLPFGKAKKAQETEQRELELQRELSVVDHFATMKLESNQERPGKPINDYFKEYNGQLLVWDGHRIASVGVAPHVPEQDAMQASRVFCDYVVPHALRNASPERQQAMQVQARFSVMLRELGQQYQQAYPDVTRKEIETVTRLPTRQQVEQALAVKQIFDASSSGEVMRGLNERSREELERMLDKMEPQSSPRSLPPTLER